MQFEAKVQEVMIRNLQAKASEMEIAVKRFLSAIEEKLAREQDRLNVTLKDLTTKQSDYECSGASATSFRSSARLTCS